MSWLKKIEKWLFDPECQDDPEFQRDNGAEGFVYKITCEVKGTTSSYIGKKSFWVRRKGRIVKESNWKTYLGSNKDMRALCEKYPQNITREILAYAQSRGELSLCEVEQQVKHDVLRNPYFLNRIIQCRIHSNNLPEKD